MVGICLPHGYISIGRIILSMIKIFVVDDRERKLESICSIMHTMYPDAEIIKRTNCKDILKAIIKDYDNISINPHGYIVVTDMQMPQKRYQGVDLNAGYHILNQLEVRELLCPAIVVSSEDIDDDLAKKYYSAYAGSIVWNGHPDQIEEYSYLLNKYFRDTAERN